MGLPRCLARQERKSGGGSRPFLPKCLDVFISLFEIRNGGSPIRKKSRGLRGRTPVPWNAQNLPRCSRQWIRGNRPSVSGRRNPKATQVVVHQIIAVPSTVILGQGNHQDRTLSESDIRRTLK